MYLLDSCVCIDFMRGRLPGAHDLLRRSDPSRFKIPAIVSAKLYLGAQKSLRRKKRAGRSTSSSPPFEIVPFDESCVQAYAFTRDELEGRGQSIGHNDLLIAATALAHNAILVTNDVKELKRVPGLALEEWGEIDLGEPLEE